MSQPVQVVVIRDEFIKLDALLKWTGVAATGGHAKVLVADGQVLVNGEVETRRGRKLHHGDEVRLVSGAVFTVKVEGVARAP